MSKRLVFDTTDTVSLLHSDNVGAYIRSGKAGAIVSHHSDVKPSAGTFDFVDGDVNTSNDTISEVGHGFNTGDLVQLSTTGTLPSPLSPATDYYVIRVDDDTVQLAASVYDAEIGNQIDITSAAGGGTHTVTGQEQDIRALDVWVVNDINIRALTQSDEITVYQGTDPWIIGDGGNSITVDATDLDIRDLVHTQDSIAIGDGVDLLAINADGSINITDNGGSLTVDATDLDIRDLSQAQDSVQSWLYDAAGNALTSTLIGADQALDVNVVGGVNVEVDLSHVDDSVALGDGTNLLTSTTIGGDIGLDVNVINDPALANTAIKAKANLLDTANTAEDVVDVGDLLANRKYLFIFNDGVKDIYIGESGVTSTNGYPVTPGGEIVLRLGSAVDIEWVGAAGATGANNQAKIKTLQIS